jgi:microsomal epoxide hydrolase
MSLFVFTAALRGATTVKSKFFTTSDGVRLHYLEAGAGPTLLFIPGWTMPAEIWQPQIDYFSAHYHVIALDPRSQGESDKPTEGNYPGRRAQDYKEMIDHLGSGPVVMIGWSLAVHEAFTYVELFGAYKLSGLVLVDMNVYTEQTPEEREARWQQFHKLQADRRAFSEYFVRGMYHKPHSEAYLNSVLAASLKTPTNTTIALLGELALKNDMRPVLAKIKIPVLAVMTEINRPQVEMITAGVPGAQGEVFSDAGHCLFVDDPDRFNTVLERFLRKSSLSPKMQ